jgi:hypothetical protein
MALNGFYHNTAAVTVHVSDNPDSRQNRRISRKDIKLK